MLNNNTDSWCTGAGTHAADQVITGAHTTADGRTCKWVVQQFPKRTLAAHDGKSVRQPKYEADFLVFSLFVMTDIVWVLISEGQARLGVM